MVFCYCGKEALIQTSRTSRNPGRRFYGCPDQAAGCGFFVWIEHVKCSRCYDVIPAIMSEKHKLQMELKVAEMKAEYLKRYLIMTWAGFFLIVIALMKM
ncbi:hypothetical protein SSX86_013618 [Deinandra increscens subsp. villosa]|uniref:GRF-type domain-containing protein n=1 Tax=Deinandra increscens subsp. villosa TaxID=3103831 RepID=A0AAP0GZJ3_9ASTR